MQAMAKFASCMHSLVHISEGRLQLAENLQTAPSLEGNALINSRLIMICSKSGMQWFDNLQTECHNCKDLALLL